jgi:hypothetical protein
VRPGRAAKGRLGMSDVLALAPTIGGGVNAGGGACAGSSSGAPATSSVGRVGTGMLGVGRNPDGSLRASASESVLPPVRTPPRIPSPGSSLQHARELPSFRDAFAAARAGQEGARPCRSPSHGGLTTSASVASLLPPLRRAPALMPSLPPQGGGGDTPREQGLAAGARPPPALPTLRGSATTASLLSPRSTADDRASGPPSARREAPPMRVENLAGPHPGAADDGQQDAAGFEDIELGADLLPL